MAFVAVGVAVAGTVASSAISSSAAKSAANQEVAGETAAEQIQQQQFAVQQQNIAPYLAAGNTALQRLSAGFSSGGEFANTFTQADLQNSPGYQYQLSQGNQAITAAAAASGRSLSPATVQALESNAQGLASTNYQQQFNDFYTARNNEVSGLQNIAGMGQNAVNQSTQASQNFANQTSSEVEGAANARAAGTIAQGNAEAGAVSGITNDVVGAYGAQQNLNALNNLYQAQLYGGGSGSTASTGPSSALNNPNYFSAGAASQVPIQTPINPTPF